MAMLIEEDGRHAGIRSFELSEQRDELGDDGRLR